MSEPAKPLAKPDAAAPTIHVTVIDVEGQIQLTNAQDEEHKQQDSRVLLHLFLLGFLFMPAWWVAIFLGWENHKKQSRQRSKLFWGSIVMTVLSLIALGLALGLTLSSAGILQQTPGEHE